jgi:hypothetical protein
MTSNKPSNKPQSSVPITEFKTKGVIPSRKEIDMGAHGNQFREGLKSGQNLTNTNTNNVSSNIKGIAQQQPQKPDVPDKHKPNDEKIGGTKRSRTKEGSSPLPPAKNQPVQVQSFNKKTTESPSNAGPIAPLKGVAQYPNTKLHQSPTNTSSSFPANDKTSLLSKSDEKTPENKPNVVLYSSPHESSLEPSPVDDADKSQLPQQRPEDEHKEKEAKLRKNERIEKEKKLLKVYNDMMNAISEFKTRQVNKKDEIKRANNEIEKLRLEKNNHAGEIKQLQVELYDLLKQVKVTDDDLSTIQKKLAALSGKLSNFPPNSKKSFNKKEPKKPEVVKFFQDCWTDDLGYTPKTKKVTVESVTNLFSQQDDIDYALVSVLVEKLVMDYFVTYIFKQPIYLNFEEINTSYDTIQKLFTEANHPEWVSNLRLKCVKATLTEVDDGGEAAERSKASRAQLCDKLLDTLSAIYDRDDIAPRIRKLVEMAADLSFPMNSQEESIVRKFLLPGDKFFTNQVKAQYGSDKSPTVVKLGISPVFLVKNNIQLEDVIGDDEDDDFMDNEDEEEEDGDKPNLGQYEPYNNDYTLVYAGRAIGYSQDSQQPAHQQKYEI